MTLFSYEIFDAVARQGSFNKAAQQLHLTPSAISHAIAVMEAELGFTLFNRGKNGVTMTSYGASLYPSIRAVLNSDEALQQSIARLNGLEKGKVKLGAFNSVCAGLLPQILKSFMASYPQIEVEVYQGTYDDVKEWLRTGQVDLAFLSATCREEFNLTELFREPLLCIVPQDWPEPPNGIMTPELMNGQSFVVQCDATDAEIEDACKQACADEFIERFPDKYQTHIEQGGANVSGGQKQRAAVARALITHPRLILADEPTGALDSRSTDELLDLFAQINRQGQTILMVTHSVKAASHAGRVLFIKDGQVFHQLYRGEDDDTRFYQRISDTLTMLQSGGEPA